MLMKNKVGIVFGLANDYSYAWFIAKALYEAGAKIIFGYLPGDKNKRRVTLALESMGYEAADIYPCEVTNDDDLDSFFDYVSGKFGKIDFVVHSVAYANKDYLKLGRFHETPRDVWTQALEISAYSLVDIANRSKEIMNDGGSIISLSYLGGEKVVPGYNVMGVAKSALEMSTRYLAMELGALKIRVNCISGGPLKTLSAMGIESFSKILEHQEKVSPLKRNIGGEEVGKTALYLLSDYSSAVTGEVIHVDSGFHVLANFPTENGH